MDFIGHTTIYEKLLRAKEKQTLHHALLFTGPEGIGKAPFAMHLAKELASPEAPIVVADGAKSIKVDDIRSLIQKAHVGSLDGGAHVFVLANAERLTPEAANALLKVLEEPPQGVYFLLSTSYAQKLLPTIRSRLQTITLTRLTADEVARILVREGIAESVARHLASLSGGNATHALRLATDTNYMALRERWEAQSHNLAQQSPGAMALFVEREIATIDKSHSKKSGQTLYQHRREQLKDGMTFLRGAMYQSYIKSRAPKLRAALEAIAEGIEHLSTPQDPGIAVTSALIKAQTALKRTIL